MGLFDFLKKKPAPEPAPEPKNTERHKVTGTSHYTDAIMALAKPNPDFDLPPRKLLGGDDYVRVYKYNFPGPFRAELVPEPDNPHDPKAIRVDIGGKTVGYIKKGSTGRVRNLLAAGCSYHAEVGGGTRKDIEHDGTRVRTTTEDSALWVDIIFDVTCL